MTLRIRVIPCLDVRDGRVVKGVNFVDTAELYGKGHSEEVIGRSLKEWKGDKIYVATKAQPPQAVAAPRLRAL